MALISIDEALAHYRDTLGTLPSHRVPVEMALGAVLAEAVHARISLPRFTQSAMDGYALRADDGLERRTLVGTSAAGEPADVRLGPGEAVRIFTGGVVPEGADAVARQEIVHRDGEAISLMQAVMRGEAIRREGDELIEGSQLAASGQSMTSGLVAAMAMAGVPDVLVTRRPRVCVLVTGDEVVRVGGSLGPGQIFDANGPLLRAWFVENGFGEPVVAYVRDDQDALDEALAAALDSADLVVTSGGVSVGDRDFVPASAERVGVRPVFWKVAQKPGKPLWFGVRDGRALLGMPGNPAAVLACLNVHARAVLARLEGHAVPQPVWRDGLLAGAVSADNERDRLVRMRFDTRGGSVLLHDLPGQESHMLSNLVAADALVRLPRREEAFAAGECVRWLPI